MWPRTLSALHLTAGPPRTHPSSSQPPTDPLADARRGGRGCSLGINHLDRSPANRTQRKSAPCAPRGPCCYASLAAREMSAPILSARSRAAALAQQQLGPAAAAAAADVGGRPALRRAAPAAFLHHGDWRAPPNRYEEAPSWRLIGAQPTPSVNPDDKYSISRNIYIMTPGEASTQ